MFHHRLRFSLPPLHRSARCPPPLRSSGAGGTSAGTSIFQCLVRRTPLKLSLPLSLSLRFMGFPRSWLCHLVTDVPLLLSYDFKNRLGGVGFFPSVPAHAVKTRTICLHSRVSTVSGNFPASPGQWIKPSSPRKRKRDPGIGRGELQRR